MPYEVAATSWTNLIGCKTYEGQKTIDAIRAFAVKHYGDAPEPIDLFPPTPGPSFSSH